MWLYLFSVLYIGSIQSLTIGYPYHTLLTYGSTHSLVKTTATQGFLIYLDNFGIERIVSYNYAEPVYAISQINDINGEIPSHQTFVQDGSTETKNVQEAHFRAWSLQQYQVLKREIDLLRAEGKEPSVEILLKFLPLEKIALTADYATIEDLPEIKRIRHEHLNIWNQVLPTNVDKTSNDNSKKLSEASEGIIAKKHAHEDKIAELKQLELRTYNSQNGQSKTNIVQSSEQQSLKADEKSNSHNIDKEDLRDSVKEYLIVPELIERTDDSNIKSSSDQISVKVKKQQFTHTVDDLKTREAQQKIIAENEKEDLGLSSVSEQKQSIKQTSDQSTVSDQPLKVLETPKIMKAHEEHLKLQLDAKKQIYAPKKMHSEIEKIISTAPGIYAPKPVIDTVEVIRLRDEHLRIVNEAILKAKFAQAQQEEFVTNMPDIPLNRMKVENIELNLKME